MNTIKRYLALALGLFVLAALVYYFSSIVAYVLIAWVLSVMGQPMMRFFQRSLPIGRRNFHISRSLAAGLTLICYFIFISLLILMFVPMIVEQAYNLADVNYGEVVDALDVPIQNFQQWLQKLGFEVEQVSMKQQLQEDLQEYFDPAEVVGYFGSILSTAGGVLISIFSVVFITFFFLRDRNLFVNFLVALAPTKYELPVRSAIEDIIYLISRYFGGLLVQISVITSVVSLGLWLLGIENALLIGFFAAIINLIPYLGPIIGAVLGIFIAISSNLELEFYSGLLPLILKIGVVFAFVQLLDNFILQPFIFSTSVLAHPLEIFIVILMGAQISGIIGMVLAIPAYTVLRVIARSFLSELNIVQKITGSMSKMDDDS